MIAPDMATMLSFVVTDAPIAAPVLQALLSKGGRATASTRSPSTATPRPPTRCSSSRPARRRARRASTSRRDRRLGAFREALDDLLLDLAHQVVRDGEGARKFVEVRVEGAVSKRSAQADRAVDRQFAAGQDRDRRRGRQLGPRSSWRSARPASRPTATGSRSGSATSASRVEGRARPGLLRSGGVRLHEDEPRSSSPSISASATASDRVWTCDLTKEYVAINGDYRS